MSVFLSPLAGAAWQFFNNNGIPLAGGFLYTYAAGTSTPQATYTTSAGSIAQANPIVLDAAGRVPSEVWLTSGVAYKFVLQDASAVQIGSWDNILGVDDFSAILAQLASTTDPTLGDSLIGFKQSNASGFMSGAVGRTVSAKLQELISVKDFGAVGDGTTDDGPAFQAAINAIAATGGRIYVPAATYLINTQVSFSNTVGGITFYGDGWGDWKGTFTSGTVGTRAGGTWLKTTNPATSPFNIAVGVNGIRFEEIGCYEVHVTPSSGWAPTAYQPFFYVLGSGFNLNRVMFWGVNKGVQVGVLGTSTGRATFDYVWGEFFTYGINIQYSADVVRINNLHIYPFWSQSQTDVTAYELAHTTGIISVRNDNPDFSNIFTYGVYKGIDFQVSADGQTNKVHVANADFDYAVYGLYFSGSTTGYFSNISVQGDAPNASGVSIYVLGNNCELEFDNLSLINSQAQGLFVFGGGNIIEIDKIQLKNWGRLTTATAIAHSGSNNTTRVSTVPIITIPGSSTLALGPGTISIPLGSGIAAGTTDGSGKLLVTVPNLYVVPNRIMISNMTNAGFGMSTLASEMTQTTFKITVFSSYNVYATGVVVQVAYDIWY